MQKCSLLIEEVEEISCCRGKESLRGIRYTLGTNIRVQSSEFGGT